MTTTALRCATVVACLLALCASSALATPGRSTLQPFADEAEFLAYLATLESTVKSAMVLPDPTAAASAAPAPRPPPAAAPAMAGTTDSLDAVVVTGSLIPQAMKESAAPVASITNVQTLGVDEGGIVKQHGDFLIVLRRGRLFTVRVGGDRLQAVDAVDAFAPGSDPAETWYDEMLVSGSTVVVIGYSYERGGTEIGLFDLDAKGRLRHRDTYQMRSNDYYSARNYASRLIGTTLVIYTPLEIQELDPDTFWPAARRWRPGPTPPSFHRILPATRIYRSTAALDDMDPTLHTVSLCELASGQLECRSTAVLGPEGHAFYVSGDSVYVWTAPYDFDEDTPNASGIWRIPLDGGAPSGLRASGSPIDQMSFLARDGVLNVVVGSDADGEGMWRSGSRAGELALLRLPLDRFGDGSQAAAPGDYRALPGLTTDHHDLQNRYLGDWLLLGETAHDHLKTPPSPLLALRYAQADPVQGVRTGHSIERIDTLGSQGAVVVGKQGADLVFTSVRLDEHAAPASQFVLPDSAQGDQRSHGYFYRPDDEDTGIAALPVVGNDARGRESASVLFLRNLALRLRRMGQLESQANPDIDDDCEVSCVDWYGNARPIFLGRRVFALLGYELVEGTLSRTRIAERRRVDFSSRLPRR